MIKDCLNYKELLPQFENRLEELEEKCLENKEQLYWANNRCKWFVHHDFYHSERVASNLDAIISLERERAELTGYEIFCLFCAAFLHDVGMSSGPKACKQVRKNHGERSAQMIDDDDSLVGEIVKNVGLKGRRKALEVIKNLCIYHHGVRKKLDDVQMEDGTLIRYERIVNIIRLADQCDVFIERSLRRGEENQYKRMREEAWEELEERIKHFVSISEYTDYVWKTDIKSENVKNIKESLQELKPKVKEGEQDKLENLVGDLGEYEEAEKRYKWHESIEKVLFTKEGDSFLIVLVPSDGVTDDTLEEVKGYISKECSGSFSHWSVKIVRDKKKVEEYEKNDPRNQSYKKLYTGESDRDMEHRERDISNLKQELSEKTGIIDFFYSDLLSPLSKILPVVINKMITEQANEPNSRTKSIIKELYEMLRAIDLALSLKNYRMAKVMAIRLARRKGHIPDANAMAEKLIIQLWPEFDTRSISTLPKLSADDSNVLCQTLLERGLISRYERDFPGSRNYHKFCLDIFERTDISISYMVKQRVFEVVSATYLYVGDISTAKTLAKHAENLFNSCLDSERGAKPRLSLLKAIIKVAEQDARAVDELREAGEMFLKEGNLLGVVSCGLWQSIYYNSIGDSVNSKNPLDDLNKKGLQFIKEIDKFCDYLWSGAEESKSYMDLFKSS